MEATVREAGSSRMHSFFVSSLCARLFGSFLSSRRYTYACTVRWLWAWLRCPLTSPSCKIVQFLPWLSIIIVSE